MGLHRSAPHVQQNPLSKTHTTVLHILRFEIFYWWMLDCEGSLRRSDAITAVVTPTLHKPILNLLVIAAHPLIDILMTQDVSVIPTFKLNPALFHLGVRSLMLWIQLFRTPPP